MLCFYNARKKILPVGQSSARKREHPARCHHVLLGAIPTTVGAGRLCQQDDEGHLSRMGSVLFLNVLPITWFSEHSNNKYSVHSGVITVIVITIAVVVDGHRSCSGDQKHRESWSWLHMFKGDRQRWQ